METQEWKEELLEYMKNEAPDDSAYFNVISFISKNFIHKDTLKKYLKEQEKEPRSAGNLPMHDIAIAGWERAIQSVIEYIEK